MKIRRSFLTLGLSLILIGNVSAQVPTLKDIPAPDLAGLGTHCHPIADGSERQN